MSRPWPSALVPALLLTVALGALQARRAPRPDDPPAPASSTDRRGVLLDDAVARCEARRAFKDRLVEELAEGRVSLREAVARLLTYLEQESSALPEDAPEVWYGRGALASLEGPEAARCARSLLLHVKARLRVRPGPAADLAARLEREAAGLLVEGGG